jgi:hypothetical protein
VHLTLPDVPASRSGNKERGFYEFETQKHYRR